jgi:hypothetical protein
LDATESFLNPRRNEFGCHLVERVIRNHTRARRVSCFADVERNIEEQGLYFASVLSRKCDERPAIASREIGRVYISYRPLKFDALFQEVTHGGEDAGVDGLVGFIVGQLQADSVT